MSYFPGFSLFNHTNLEKMFCHFYLQHFRRSLSRSRAGLYPKFGHFRKKSAISVQKMFCHFYRPFHTFIIYSLHFWIKLNSTKLIWMCPEGQNPSQFTALEIKKYVILMLFSFKNSNFCSFWPLWEIFGFFRITIFFFLRKLRFKNFWKSTTWFSVNMIWDSFLGKNGRWVISSVYTQIAFFERKNHFSRKWLFLAQKWKFSLNWLLKISKNFCKNYLSFLFKINFEKSPFSWFLFFSFFVSFCKKSVIFEEKLNPDFFVF